MKKIEREISRYLNLLRSLIRQKGFTQMEVQEVLSWGRSYISQLVNQQKALRVEQVLLMLDVIGVEPAEFFAELYQLPGAPSVTLGLRAAAREPRVAGELPRELQRVQVLLDGLVRLLLEKKIITLRDLRAAEQQAMASGD